MIRVIRWHLLRAAEARNSSLFPAAQRELDLAFNRLGQFDTEDDAHREANKTADELRRQVEQAYLSLVPHLEHFSPDSPLVLLLEGISEAELESLPKDASPFVRIHQLSRHCDVPIDANARVAASIRFFQTKGRETYMSWYKRSWKYRDLILRVLAAEGLPKDLLYLAMIESGFNPKAYSRAHAAGMWQFMESTGRLEGLSRTHWVDERRDPMKSTRAAARHLKRLYAKFGDWRLAIAAYNGGPNRVRRAVKKQSTRDYWKLKLPRETRNYVPLFMAATIISKGARTVRIRRAPTRFAAGVRAGGTSQSAASDGGCKMRRVDAHNATAPEPRAASGHDAATDAPRASTICVCPSVRLEDFWIAIAGYPRAKSRSSGSSTPYVRTITFPPSRRSSGSSPGWWRTPTICAILTASSRVRDCISRLSRERGSGASSSSYVVKPGDSLSYHRAPLRAQRETAAEAEQHPRRRDFPRPTSLSALGSNAQSQADIPCSR